MLPDCITPLWHLSMQPHDWNLFVFVVAFATDAAAPLLFVPHSKVESDTSTRARMQLQDSLSTAPFWRLSVLGFEICQIFLAGQQASTN